MLKSNFDFKFTTLSIQMMSFSLTLVCYFNIILAESISLIPNSSKVRNP